MSVCDGIVFAHTAKITLCKEWSENRKKKTTTHPATARLTSVQTCWASPNERVQVDVRQSKKCTVAANAFKRMWLHFFSVVGFVLFISAAEWFKQKCMKCGMCKYALENSKRFHQPSLPRCTFITLTNWHSTIAMYFVSIEIYSATNGSISIELLRAEQKMMKIFSWEWTFEWCIASNRWMWGCWMLSLSGLSRVSKCNSMAIHEIFSDFESSKCDLREQAKQEQGESDTDIDISSFLSRLIFNSIRIVFVSLANGALSVHTSFDEKTFE